MSTRVDRLVTLLGDRGLDALVVTNLPNLRWVTGFTGTNGVAVVGPEVHRFYTDFRYTEQAGEQVPGFEILRAGPDLLGEVAKDLQGRVGFEDASLSFRSHARLAEGSDAELVGASGIVEELRSVKDEQELVAIRAAVAIADRAYKLLVEQGIDGRTEKQIAADLEATMRRLGADDRSFAAIVASGAHGALPHAEARDVPVELDTLMVVDMGCMVDGYCSDATRTFATGALGERAREVYDVVARAQQAGLDAVRSGADCREVDGAARAVITDAGFGDHFGHGLGHGVGIEVHEAPRLAQSADGSLRAGHVVTVEPGVYLPGELGVRIEDLVVVTDDGADVLTGFTKSLVELR